MSDHSEAEAENHRLRARLMGLELFRHVNRRNPRSDAELTEWLSKRGTVTIIDPRLLNGTKKNVQ